LFYNTGISTYLWVLNNRKSKKWCSTITKWWLLL
jgi:type I restriction-modification system DNA methylase subunit